MHFISSELYLPTLSSEQFYQKERDWAVSFIVIRQALDTLITLEVYPQYALLRAVVSFLKTCSLLAYSLNLNLLPSIS